MTNTIRVAPLSLALAMLTTVGLGPAGALDPLHAQQTGWIEGTVELPNPAPRRTASRYPGAAPAARTVQDLPAVAYLSGGMGAGSSADHAAPASPLEMAQQDTAFAPPLLVVPLGATVEFPNRDPFFHNVFSYSSTRRFDLGRFPRGESKAVTFDQPGIVKIYCEVHESMRAAVVVVTNPYHAVVSADGTFRLDGVPPGEHTLLLWQHEAGTREIPVRVTAGRGTTVRADFD